MLIHGQFSASTAIMFQNDGHLKISNSNKSSIYDRIWMKLATSSPYHMLIQGQFLALTAILFKNGSHVKISNSNKKSIYEPIQWNSI